MHAERKNKINKWNDFFPVILDSSDVLKVLKKKERRKKKNREQKQASKQNKTQLRIKGKVDSLSHRREIYSNAHR